ncbi:MAG: flagellar filament capping protein FliD, partial [Planctomycetes bacterium]|nr:flagellar filament capping protein FliD [Planctomycetota bacterium]
LIQNADHTPATRTIQEVIDRINNDADNGGTITASIVPEPEPNANVSLRIKDNTGGLLSNLIIASTIANPYAARDLGIEADVAADDFDGNRLIAGINSVLVASLNGGAGLSGNNSLTINDRSGGSDTFALDEDGSLSEIIDLINNSGAINITASLNNSGNGLLITDTVGGGGNLTISGTAASELGIAADVAADSVRGTSLQIRYVAEGSTLTGLNYGRGIGTGEFRITDGDGRIATVKIGTDAISLYDIIREINGQASAASPPLSINARVNDNGDGLLIENTGGSGIIRVDTINGTTAADLGIVGQAASDGADIDGSFEKTVTVNKADTLSEIVSAINDAGIPVTASILNTGAGPTPFQISFSSLISGTPGALVIDAKDDTGAVFDLGLTTISQGQNAKVFFGSNDPAQGVLIERSSNTLTDVLSGVTVDLVSASSSPVTLTVTRDTSGITEKVAEFVDAFNDVIARIDQYDFFDVETETRGPLLGNTTTAQVRNALFNIVNRTTTGVTTKFTRLSEVGIRIGSDSNLVFDQAKFLAAYQDDPIAVENLFAALKSTTTTTQQIAPGVTITKNETTFSQLGFGDLFDQLLDNLTNSIDGTLTIADESLQDKIDLTTKRIEEFDERIQIQRERMQREFTAMETALALLQNQSNALLSLVGNLTFAQNLFSNTVRR